MVEANTGYCFSYWNLVGPPDDFGREASSSCESTSIYTVTTSSSTPQQTYQAVFERQ